MAEETITLPNEIAQNLLAAETSSDSRYNASARNLVAEKPVLAYILRAHWMNTRTTQRRRLQKSSSKVSPQIRKVAIHQKHPDSQLPVVEDMAESIMAAEYGMMSGDDKVETSYRGEITEGGRRNASVGLSTKRK